MNSTSLTESSDEASVIRPDFFIVGAPKSGTTALASYLAGHKDIAMCRRKEVHYFGSDLRADETEHGLSETEYLGLFPREGQSRTGEASVWYLYSTQAAIEIKEFCPDANIVLMLRNPPDMLYSLHSQFLWGGKEEFRSFEEALAHDPHRQRGEIGRRFLPRTYREAAAYCEQIQRYWDVFGAERIHIEIYEEFAAGPAEAYVRVCDFLGVTPDVPPTMRVVNASRRARSQRLQNALFHPPIPIQKVAKAVSTKRARLRLRDALRRLNRVRTPRAPLAASTRGRLQEEFSDEYICLEKSFGLNLERWR